jgi:excisionase family DNA binding protein
MRTLMNVKETSQYLKLNQMTVYKLAQQGKIPSMKVGGNWRFKKDILDRWLTDQSRNVKKNILIVDDDFNICDVLTNIVSEYGYNVTAVNSGEDALVQVENQHFDLIFLDLVLPGLSGVEVLRKIKVKDKSAPVVVITGYGNDPIALEAISIGPQLLMRKPFTVSDIVEVLNLVVKTRR